MHPKNSLFGGYPENGVRGVPPTRGVGDPPTQASPGGPPVGGTPPEALGGPPDGGVPQNPLFWGVLKNGVVFQLFECLQKHQKLTFGGFQKCVIFYRL